METHKPRINGYDTNGCTALNLAARGGYPKIVDYLLSKGANAAIADNQGWTPAAVSAG